MTNELKMIFSDNGVLVVFFLAGLAYPIIYNLIYSNGSIDDMPIAVVDMSESAESREFIRKLDATREVEVVSRCTDIYEGKISIYSENVFLFEKHRNVLGIYFHFYPR